MDDILGFFWREQGIFGVIWLYCLHAGIGLAVLAVSALKKCPFLLTWLRIRADPHYNWKNPLLLFFALSLGHSGEIEILNSNLNCTKALFSIRAALAPISNIKNYKQFTGHYIQWETFKPCKLTKYFVILYFCSF